MYLIYHDGWEMKAQKEKNVRDWLATNQVDAAFSWSELREDGETESLCGNWSICKVDGRTVRDVDFLSNFAMFGRELIRMY